MPIYDYSCNACSHEFEALVRGSSAAELPGVRESGSRAEAVLPRGAIREHEGARSKAAVKRRDAAQAKDNAHEQRKYEASHDD